MKNLQQLQPLLLLLPLLLPTTTTTTTTTKCIANSDIYNSSAAASTSITELGIRLLRELGTQRNILISPYSIWSVLAMVFVGAEGETERQMGAVLGLEGKAGVLALWRMLDESLQSATANDSRVSLNLASRIYIQQGLKIKKCQTELSNLLVPLDLVQAIQASNTINAFVNKTTEGLIPEIITPEKLGPDTLMVILNAIYFKGAWKYPFPKKNTSPKPFYVTPNSDPVMVDTMQMNDMHVLISYSQELGAQVLQLPYSAGSIAMSIFLPLSKGEAEFNATLKALTATSLRQAIGSVKKAFYDVQIPKFVIKSKFADELKTALHTLGIKDLFTTAANLTSFTDNLYVKHIMHKTVVKVDEEGTEAAGATGAVLITKIRSVIRVNRPFLFAIHDRDTVLFIGAYRRP